MDLLISDSGSEFKKEVTNVCNALQIQQKYTVAHRAMGHGAVERVNRTVKARIKAFAKEGRWRHRLSAMGQASLQQRCAQGTVARGHRNDAGRGALLKEGK